MPDLRSLPPSDEVVDHEVEQWFAAPTLYDRMTHTAAITFTIVIFVLALMTLAVAASAMARLAVWIWP